MKVHVAFCDEGCPCILPWYGLDGITVTDGQSAHMGRERARTPLPHEYLTTSTSDVRFNTTRNTPKNTTPELSLPSLNRASLTSLATIMVSSEQPRSMEHNMLEYDTYNKSSANQD